MQFSDGVYQGKFIKGELCRTKTENKPQVACDFLVSMVAGRDGEGKPAWQPLSEPTTRTVYLSLVENAKPYTAKKLTSLGFDGNFSGVPLSFAKLNTPIRLQCSMEEYKGKVRQQWDLLDWGGAVERVPIESAEAVVLNAWWQATAAPAPVDSPTSTPVASPASAPVDDSPPLDEDRIPF